MAKDHTFSAKLLVDFEKDTISGIAYCVEAKVEVLVLAELGDFLHENSLL